MVRIDPIQPVLYMALKLSVIVYIKRSIESVDILLHRPIVQNIYFTRVSIRSPDSVMYVLLISCITKELVPAIN
jgi:hypothetical protein